MKALQRKSLGWLAASLAGLALVSLSPALSDAGTRTRVKSQLAATSVDPDARGKAGLALHGSDGRLDLRASHLSRNASFDVVVNGVKVGMLQTTRSGSGRQRFRSDPGQRDLVLGFDPRGAQLSVRDGAGRDVLVGTMPAAVDPTIFACCVTDATGTSMCSEITPEACTTLTGVVSVATSCMPDPCAATSPPPAAVVCCINETDDDESESECEDKTEADCAAVGGMTLQAESCEPNPCAPVAPPAGDVAACCLTDENEIECEVRTSEACTARGGAVMAGSTCNPNPCGAGTGSDDDGDDDDGDDDGEGGDDGGGGGEHHGGDD